tara:strand:- start:613 stop:1110 length:498 start_codon:yes stop_codon:yes gene_type:complete
MTQYFAAIASTQDPFDNSKTNWQVTEVVCVGDDIPTADGKLGDNPLHADGEAWCANWFKGGTWKQCFKDNGLRKNFPSKGDIYDYAKDKFLKRQPYASWTLNSDDDWESPVPYPTIETYDDNGNAMPYSIFWDEPDQMWKALDQNTPKNTFEWNPETLTWDTPTP